MKEFSIYPAYDWNAFELRILDRDKTQNIVLGNGLYSSFARPLQWEIVEQGKCPPIVERLKKQELQSLFDELWRNGIRPTVHENAESKVEAMKEHIRDLRLITFKSLKIEVKE